MIEIILSILKEYKDLSLILFGFMLHYIYDKIKAKSIFKSYIRALFHEIDSNIKIIDDKRYIPIQISERVTVKFGIEPILITTAYTSLIFSGYFEKLPLKIRTTLEEVYGFITIRNGFLASSLLPVNITQTIGGQKVTISGSQIVAQYTSLIKEYLQKVKNQLFQEYSFLNK
jgi:hypothetical protein